jgi:hypothetical protein
MPWYRRPLMALATSGAHVAGVKFIDRIGKGLRTSPPASLLAVDEQAPATPRPIVVKVAVRS